AQTVLTLAGLVAAFVSVIGVAKGLPSHGDGSSFGAVEAMGAIAVDGPSLFIWGTLLIFSIISVLLFAERQLEGGMTAFAGQAAALPGTEAEREASSTGVEHTEVFPLVMFAVGGMMLFPASNDLLTMFVALEVLSLPLYLLCGLARRRRLISQEAALKYFLLGAFSSAFFLYGIALVYGYAGSFELAKIDAAISSTVGASGLLLTGIALLAVGLLFKVSAAPFHAWTPDVYQGAPTGVTAFMAACTKVAAFGALLRVFYVALGGARWDWEPMMWIVAVLTMAIGSIIAITQTDIKRMLAYSSIAHAGFLLTGFVGAQQGLDIAGREISSLQAVMFYLVAYGFTTIGAFAIVTMVRDAGGETTHLSRWAGLGKEAPVVAGVFAFFLLALAGIPLTSGFTGKWAVFTSAWAGGAWPLVVVAVLMSVVAAVFYVRVIVVMFFSDPVGEGPTVAVPSFLTTTAVTIGAAMTAILGIVPQPVFDLARHAGEFIR
ncbi:MAG: NADH-quinone oxidoreductase subunit NuoN, partial [Propionibacteriales bacterium]|nr:NADH-quinone oxidoreductase subunit NuoN [Propionibacteriales bacterium]